VRPDSVSACTHRFTESDVVATAIKRVHSDLSPQELTRVMFRASIPNRFRIDLYRRDAPRELWSQWQHLASRLR
jgi:hypothetical protein